MVGVVPGLRNVGSNLTGASRLSANVVKSYAPGWNVIGFTSAIASALVAWIVKTFSF